MAGQIEIISMQTEPCPSCRARHRHRIALAAADGGDATGLLGFFGICPVTRQRVWLVGQVPQGLGGRSRILDVGPAEADGPAAPETGGPMPPTDPAAGPSSGRIEPRATIQMSSPRGKAGGGFRGRSRGPEMLRLALGCPFS